MDKSSDAAGVVTSGWGDTYPETRRGDVLETLHGVEVADPYRWLEDLDAPETADWVRRQNETTFAWLEQVPERSPIRDRLRSVMDYERYGVPYRRGGRYFYEHNSGLQNQQVLCVCESLDGEPRILLDPNTLSEDGTVAVGPSAVSPNGDLLAYGLQRSGSDWIEWRVRDVATGQDFDDRIEWSKFSGASWTQDSKGFYYSAYDRPAEGEAYEEANRNQRLHYHLVGATQAQDRLVLEDPDHPDIGFGGAATDDGRYLVVFVWEGTARENRLWYRDLETGGEFVRLLDDNDAKYEFLGNVGATFYVQTDLDADRSRILAIDLGRPDREHWREVVPEAQHVLSEATLVGGRLTATYLEDAHSVVRLFELDGTTVRDVALPGIGSTYGFHGKPDDPETFFSFTGFTTPPVIFRYDVETGRSEVFRRASVDVDADAYETHQDFVASKDGTKIPVFLVHAKGLVRDGSTPVLLTGYGGFNIPLTPGFGASHHVWLEMGGMLVVANLRGGGEYGEAWHRAGTKERKQNVFDDFIAVAEWLVEEKYTATPRLAIQGGSNGGLLVGACMTQRPDLFGACLPAVGVLDMLRYHHFTIGWAWVSDYGSPDDADAFETLRAYSPLHNLEPGACYPPTLVTTGDHDDRVVPSHSFKFAAALQRAQGCGNPCLIRVEVSAGHGAGKPVSKIIEELADKWAFLVRVLGMELPAGFGA